MGSSPTTGSVLCLLELPNRHLVEAPGQGYPCSTIAVGITHKPLPSL